MGPYIIPRNTKGEGRILYIFSTKALIYTGVGVVLGLGTLFLFKFIGLVKAGYISILVLGGLGFAIASFKIPDSNKYEVTRKAGGQNIDEIILRWFKFKIKKNVRYIYDEEEMKDE